MKSIMKKVLVGACLSLMLSTIAGTVTTFADDYAAPEKDGGTLYEQEVENHPIEAIRQKLWENFIEKASKAAKGAGVGYGCEGQKEGDPFGLFD